MADVFYVSPEHTHAPHHALLAVETHYVAGLAPLLGLFFKTGNDELDLSRATVVILHSSGQSQPHNSVARSSPYSALDTLSYDDQALLLRFFFSHMNLIVVSLEELANERAVAGINAAIRQIDALISRRIARVATWTGTGVNINDPYTQHESMFGSHHDQDDSHVCSPVAESVATMSYIAYHHSNISREMQRKVVDLNAMITESINFESLLQDHYSRHLAVLCHAVGHWAFPAHELSNDDLIYCVYVMFRFVLDHVQTHGAPESLKIPCKNELFALIYMVRDTYKNGNSFHNFRHAVDVIQACFHFLIRLGCLPRFEQFEIEPRGVETPFLKTLFPKSTTIELVAKSGDSSVNASGHPLLTPLQGLGLMVAALGHDVGHPGVTNAFMIKHSAPTSQLYIDRSVLESYHASVFVNKILSVVWPSLLSTETSTNKQKPLGLKHLIINSILATDMAEHFEYVNKLKEMELNSAEISTDRVKLICSLLIKCADISNVTRPLLVSSQWASVLSQEFSECEKLESAIQKNTFELADVSHSELPASLDDILKEYPDIHKGQIFFIQTFAESLFNSMSSHFPALQYTSDIIQENNQFWLNRVECLKAPSIPHS